MNIAIFGARSIALGVYKAMQEVYQEYKVEAFLVTSKTDNPEKLADIPVFESASYENKNICVLIATPESTHEEIMTMLKRQGYSSYVCIESKKEAALMERYYHRIDKFPSIRTLLK